MECPNCGKTDNKVIDSRLSKDGIAIRRRRRCLICSSRFTTYEATEERLLPFLVTKNVERDPTVTNLKAMVSFMSNTLNILSKETETLVDKIKKREKAQAAQEAKKKVRERKIAKRKAKSLMMTETVFKVIKRHKRGVHISKLRDKTGFDNKKISNIVFKLNKEGKIKRAGKGIYIVA
jgi:transcriptional repressor NrdR